MPRVGFEKKENFLKWIKHKVCANKHESYVTDKNEIIVAPKKSTRPITFGYFKSKSQGDELTAEIKIIVTALRAARVIIYRCDNYEWKTDSPIGSVYNEE